MELQFYEEAISSITAYISIRCYQIRNKYIASICRLSNLKFVYKLECIHIDFVFRTHTINELYIRG